MVWLVMGLLLALYTLTYSGAFRVDDEHLLAARGQSLALWGRLENPQVYGNDRVRFWILLDGMEGEQARAVEPGQAVLLAWLYRLGIGIGAGGTRMAFTLNIYLTAGTACLILLTIRSIGLSDRTAMLSALAFGTATMAWPYTKTLFRDPLAALFATLSFYGWVVATREPHLCKWQGWCCWILGVVGGLLSKNTVGALLPGYAAGGLILALRRRERAAHRSSVITVGTALLVGLLAAYAFLPREGALARFTWPYLMNVARHMATSVSASSAVAALGAWVSPGKSIFLFSPILVLSLVTMARLSVWRHHWWWLIPASVQISILPVAQALFYRANWAGGLGWGLRYMLPVLPLLVIVAAPTFEVLDRGASRLWRSLVKAIWGGAVFVQVAATTVSWFVPYRYWLDAGENPFVPTFHWRLIGLSIPYHVRHLLDPQHWDIAWVRAVGSLTGLAVVPLLCMLLVGMSVYLIFLWIRGRDCKVLALRFAPSLCVVALLMPLISVRVLEREPSLAQERLKFEDLVRPMRSWATSQDLVIIDSYGTRLWESMMNYWDRPIPWYSLPFEIPGAQGVGWGTGGPPGPEAIRLFSQVGGPYKRLWYLISEDAPDAALAREKGWLDATLCLERAWRVSGIDMYLYDTRDRGACQASEGG